MLGASWQVAYRALDHTELSRRQVWAIVLVANAAVPPLIVGSLSVAHRLLHGQWQTRSGDRARCHP